jgi:hypothetical protein
MSTTAPASSISATHDSATPRPGVAGRLLTWLTIQLAALVAGAVGLRFSADYADPGDLESLRLMLVVQLVTATALYRYVCGTPTATIATATSVWPFVLLAGFLSGEPMTQSALAAMYVSIWVAGLGLIKPTISLPLSSTTAAILNLVVMGGPLFSYLSSEFGGRRIPRIGPVFDVFRIIDGGTSISLILLPIIMVLFALTTRLPRR